MDVDLVPEDWTGGIPEGSVLGSRTRCESHWRVSAGPGRGHSNRRAYAIRHPGGASVSAQCGSCDRRSVFVELTEAGKELIREAPSLLQERFRAELTRLEEWERTMILATLQRTAGMMDAELIEAMPVLGSDVVGANEDDHSRYLEKAVGASSGKPRLFLRPDTSPP